MDGRDVLTQQLTVRCLAPAPEREIAAELRYEARDPFAVAITFDTGREYVRWDLARSLLVQGLTDPAGEGDVVLWPSVDEEGRSVVAISLCSPHGELLGELRTNQLHRFLGRSLALVPIGTESDHLDIDAAVARLLGSDAQ